MNSDYAAERAAAAGRPLPILRFDPTKHGIERWLGPRESSIMITLWARAEPCTVKRVWRELQKQGERIAYTTVMTIMTRMYQKAMIDRVKRGLAFVYTIRETREAFEERQIAIIVESIGRAE